MSAALKLSQRDRWLSRPNFTPRQHGLRSAIERLRDRSLDVDDFDTAKLCRAALVALDPWCPPEERRPLSAHELDTVQKCRRAIKRRGLRWLQARDERAP